jgi:hypothetical protein
LKTTWRSVKLLLEAHRVVAIWWNSNDQRAVGEKMNKIENLAKKTLISLLLRACRVPDDSIAVDDARLECHLPLLAVRAVLIQRQQEIRAEEIS